MSDASDEIRQHRSHGVDEAAVSAGGAVAHPPSLSTLADHAMTPPPIWMVRCRSDRIILALMIIFTADIFCI